MFLLQRCVLLCSLTGFIVQVTQVSKQYFAFGTTTSVKLSRPTHVKNHPIAVCIRYSDLIDTARLERETGIKLHFVNGLKEAFKNQELLTVDQIFEHTPPPESFIESCMFRQDHWTITKGNTTLCNQAFKVSKFFTLETMCYRIEQIAFAKMPTTAITQSSFYRSQVFKVTLTANFANIIYLYAMAFTGELPNRSRDNAPILPRTRSPGNRSHVIFNTLYLTPADIMIKLLEAPYDTRCIHRRAGLYHKCRQQCLVEKYKPWNRVPDLELVTERYKVKPLSAIDLSDSKIKNMTDKYIKECKERCDSIPCSVDFSETSVRIALKEELAFQISSVMPSQHDKVIIAQPQMFFVEFFSFICGCFGTWFGLSFLSLGPGGKKAFRIRSKAKVQKTDPFMRASTSWRNFR